MLHVVAVLTVKDRAKLDAFESRAMQILTKHGGELLVAFTSTAEQSGQSGQSEEYEKEVHHLRFPDLASFQGYRDDPELKALSSLREEGISNTQIHVSTRIVDYCGNKPSSIPNR